MNLFRMLQMRTEFESLVSGRSRFDLPSREGDINSLRYFVSEGHKKNRFRKHYARALELAETILGEYDGSSKETGAG